MPKRTLHWLKISCQNFKKVPPIIIYQMGKVGSTSIAASLRKASLKNPIYQVHFLSHGGIQQAEAFLSGLQKKIKPPHLVTSKILRKKMDRHPDIPWKIITLVREPIAREISDVFQVIDRYHPGLLNQDGTINRQAAVAFLKKRFLAFDESCNYTSTWFDKEIKQVFGIDVYEHPFNHEEGFAVIQHKNCDLLILRLENLDSCFNRAIAAFLGLSYPVGLIPANVGRSKQYADAYQFVLKNLRLPQAVCARIYSAKYARHFYTDAMLEDFTQRWSEK